MGKKRKKTLDDWAEAKRRCRLNEETVRMAKELGMSPRSLIKNIPPHDQQWKAPVHEWVRDLYAKRQAKMEAGRSRRGSDAPSTAAEGNAPGEAVAKADRDTPDRPRLDTSR